MTVRRLVIEIGRVLAAATVGMIVLLGGLIELVIDLGGVFARWVADSAWPWATGPWSRYRTYRRLRTALRAGRHPDLIWARMVGVMPEPRPIDYPFEGEYDDACRDRQRYIDRWYAVLCRACRRGGLPAPDIDIVDQARERIARREGVAP